MSWKTVLIRVVVGIVKNDGKILIAKRPVDKPYSGYWEFPGGKIEANESSLSALRRELAEEIGIQVLDAQPLFTHEHVYPDKTVNLDIWYVAKYQGEPHNKEAQELRWVNWEEMQKLNLLEGNWLIFEKLQQVISL